jgi:hypothetical protein
MIEFRFTAALFVEAETEEAAVQIVQDTFEQVSNSWIGSAVEESEGGSLPWIRFHPPHDSGTGNAAYLQVYPNLATAGPLGDPSPGATGKTGSTG